MGHQFPRAVAATALVLVAACGGGSEDTEPPPVLENARRQVDSIAPPESAVDGAAPAPPDELPAPDPSTFEGANRVVNLWVGPDGDTTSVDVWGRRTFSNGPILLAADIGFGETSSPAGAPTNYELSIVGAGAGPDGIELADMINAADGELVTTVFTNADRDGGARSVSIWEQGADQAPEPPRDGLGLVRLVAVNLDAVGVELVRAIGTESFSVGDGAGACRPERGRDDELGAAELRSTGDAELELEPGPATLTLHPHARPEDCGAAAVIEFVVDVGADTVTVVLVYSRDGSSIETLVLPTG